MKHFFWPSIGAYCVFTVFVYYQQLHVKNFQGSSQAFGFILSLFVFAGMITGIGYLIYYGWHVVWWAPLIIFVLGLASTVPGVLLERAIGMFAMSLLGFVVLPVCAYFMFKFVPIVT